MRNLMKTALASALILSGCASGKNYANPHLSQLKGQHILTLVDRADFADVCVREDGSKVYYLQNSAKSGEPGRACEETASGKLNAVSFVTDETGDAPVANYEPMFDGGILMNILAAADLIKKLKNPSLVYLYEDKIYQTKKGVTINLADITQMRKSPYQILGAIPKNPFSAIVIPFMFVLAAFVFYVLIFIAKCVLRAFDKDVNLSYFCNLAVFSQTSVINIYFISKSDYTAVREYFASKLGTDVANAPWTIKFYDPRNLNQL